MYVGNDLIEAVPINPADLKVPGYLGKFKRTLKSKYAELIQMATEAPEFLVSDPEITNNTFQQTTFLPHSAVQKR
jgi:hypothetical protein